MELVYRYKNVSSDIIEAILVKYQAHLSSEPTEHIKFFIKIEDKVAISIFKNKTVLFQGTEAHKIAGEFFGEVRLPKPVLEHEQKAKTLINFDVIGCDEVGVGDFFGPLVTCCAYISEDFIKENQDIYSSIQDSKKITDVEIVNLYSKLKDRIQYKVYIMDNAEYNTLYTKYRNTHKLKAIAHNRALNEAMNDISWPKNKEVVMDQFVNEKKYFEYLGDQENVVKNIYFQTKAESIYPSVAAASIIARYNFLTQINKLKSQYQIDLPLGASNDVKKLVRKYKEEFKDETKNFIKLHFNDN
ncbi:ribonuclease HIII [Spiroplasma endosymbiont of Crioceris asparagi]|uniref:ribonuclease HIII n=1 Tax=Spiroplasma endosymbiont of Crioceris asparagi TaxID=3066286 RepID=UPI0030CD7C55